MGLSNAAPTGEHKGHEQEKVQPNMNDDAYYVSVDKDLKGLPPGPALRTPASVRICFLSWQREPRLSVAICVYLRVRVEAIAVTSALPVVLPSLSPVALVNMRKAIQRSMLSVSSRAIAYS
eukprot:1154188-Pelagomonas_calceolata.AAC.1